MALAPIVTVVMSLALGATVALRVVADEGDGIARKVVAPGPVLYPQVLLSRAWAVPGTVLTILGIVAESLV